LRQRPLEIFFPLALKFKLGRFEVRHALSYFFAFEEPVFGFRQIWLYDRFSTSNWRQSFNSNGLSRNYFCTNVKVSSIRRSRSFIHFSTTRPSRHTNIQTRGFGRVNPN